MSETADGSVGGSTVNAATSSGPASCKVPDPKRARAEQQRSVSVLVEKFIGAVRQQSSSSSRSSSEGLRMLQASRNQELAYDLDSTVTA